MNDNSLYAIELPSTEQYEEDIRSFRSSNPICRKSKLNYENQYYGIRYTSTIV